MKNVSMISNMPKSFWVFWAIEFWERFGFYGMQAIATIYFLKYLGFTQAHSIYLWGAFFSFVYGFIWLGGFIGDEYLGAKRCIFLGSFILMAGYTAMAFATAHTIYYALGIIIVGNALFKANPSSLISKLYAKGDPALDSAMTLYYMAVNIGAFASMALTPIIAENHGWQAAFLLCSLGLLCGILSFYAFYGLVTHVYTEAGREPMAWKRLFSVIIGAAFAALVFGKLLSYIFLCYSIVAIVTTGGFLWFIVKALRLHGSERSRMLVAFVLILEGIMFFVLYNQMPTSLTYFAVHNVNNLIFGWHIPPAEYQALNPFYIFLLSPLLAFIYQRVPGTHATKFCIGMSLCSMAFLILYFPQFTSPSGFASPMWILVSYFFQSAGELLISGLGLAMVAELCPPSMSGFVMGIWFLTTMLAGPISAWLGALTVPPTGVITSVHTSLQIYCSVFGKIGLFTAGLALLMWLFRPVVNQIIRGK